MGIKQSSIEELRNRINLVDVAGQFTSLKRAGREFRGLSPFKPEKTPSFYVNPDKNLYYCYSSGERGDLFRFVQTVNNMGFVEALEWLSDRFGIPLEYESGAAGREEFSRRKHWYGLNEEAALFYRERFLEDGELGAFARDYWTGSRGFAPETADSFQIGIAPVEKGHLVDFLSGRGYREDDLDSSGLFFERRRSRSFLERFRGRLMIPIRDQQGRVVGFSARQLPLTPEDDVTREAKYVNSPDGDFFHKGRLLFGLDRARVAVRDGDPLVLVEGQLDAIRLHELGITSAVAGQGTAVTADHLQLARQYASAMIILLDGDRAGRDAAVKLLPLGLRAGLELRFAPLGAGEDPDTIGRAGGGERLRQLLAEAIDGISFVTRLRAPEPASMSAEAKERVVRDLFDMIANADSEIVRETLLEGIARNLMLGPDAVLRDWNRYLRRSKGPPRREPELPGNPPPEVAFSPPPDVKLTTAVGDLLSLLLHFEPVREAVSGRMDCTWVDGNAAEARLLRRWVSGIQEGIDLPGLPVDSLPADDEERAWLAREMARRIEIEEPLREAERCLQSLYQRWLKARRASVSAAIKQLSAGQGDESGRLDDLVRQLRQLRDAAANPPRLMHN